MRCPNCKLLTSDKKNTCPKCNHDLRSKKIELGLSTAEEVKITPKFTKPDIPAKAKAPESESSKVDFAVMNSITSATLQIDNAIQEVAKKSLKNQASFEALPIVADDLISAEEMFVTGGSSDNLLFDEPVAALDISDEDLDLLLSTTAHLDTPHKPANKKDMLSSLLTKAAYSTPPKPVIKEPAARPVPPPASPPDVMVSSPGSFEIEFEIESAPTPPQNIKLAKPVSTWEIEHSSEAIRVLQQLVSKFDDIERTALFGSIEELTGFNLEETYPELVTAEPVSTEIERVETIEVEPIEVVEVELIDDLSVVPEESATPESEAVTPQEIVTEPVVAASPDFSLLWQDAVNENYRSNSALYEIGGLELLDKPDRKFIDPLFERLMTANEFDPNSFHSVTNSAAEHRRVENSELQNALMSFVKEEQAIEESKSAEDVWTEELPVEFGERRNFARDIFYALILGFCFGIGSLLLTGTEGVFDISKLLLSIIDSGSSELLPFVLAAVACRILFWTLLIYPAIRMIRSMLSSRV